VKNDQRDCEVLGDLLRSNMLPEAWISTPEVRLQRELVRYRAKLVGLRSGLKTLVHAVIAKRGLIVTMSDLFGKGGREFLAHLLEVDPWFHSPCGQRIESLLVLIAGFDAEIDELNDSITCVPGSRWVLGDPGDPRCGPGPGRYLRGRDRPGRPIRLGQPPDVVVWGGGRCFVGLFHGFVDWCGWMGHDSWRISLRRR
jgi:hypothetical protein